jgi:hypothetical protein
MKKRKLCLITILGGILLFTLAMISFVVLAVVTKGDVSSLELTLAWIFLILIILGSMLTVLGAILIIIFNKDNISEYIKKISK